MLENDQLSLFILGFDPRLGFHHDSGILKFCSRLDVDARNAMFSVMHISKVLQAVYFFERVSLYLQNVLDQ